MGHLWHGELLNNQMVDFPHWSPFLCHQVSAVAAAPRGAQDGSPLVPRAACWSWDERSRAWAAPRDWAQAAVPLRGQWSFGGLRKIGMNGKGRERMGKDGRGKIDGKDWISWKKWTTSMKGGAITYFMHEARHFQPQSEVRQQKS